MFPGIRCDHGRQNPGRSNVALIHLSFLTCQICRSQLLMFPTDSEGSWLLLSQVTVPSVPGATARRKCSSCNSWQTEKACRWGHFISTQQSLQTCQLPLNRKKKMMRKLVARFKPRGFKLNLAIPDEPFVKYQLHTPTASSSVFRSDPVSTQLIMP